MDERLWAQRAWHTRTGTRDVVIDSTLRGRKSRCAHTLTGHEGFDQFTAELPGLYIGRSRAKRLLHQPVDSTSASTTKWIPHGGEQCALMHLLASFPDLEGHRHLADHTRNDLLPQSVGGVL